MTERPLIIVGFVPPALPSLSEFQADGTVIFIDEPDVIRKRDIASKVAGSPLMRELIAWEYQMPGAADEFYNARRDLDPAVVVPLTEYATPFAARLAERYGLPGATAGAALILRDKALLRKVARAAGIANPESVEVVGPDQVREFMAAHPGPVVLKPTNRQAAVGTMVVDSPDDVETAWAECVVQDEGIMVPDRDMPLRMLVERFVRGHEYSVEMLVRAGAPVFSNVTGKVLYPGRRPVELGHVVPADIDDELTALLCARTTEVLRAVGFAYGIVHCEWIVEDGVPHLVECAGRFAGDGIAELIERAYPIELVKQFYTLMRGDELPELPQRASRAAAVRFVDATPGVVESVDGVEAARALDGVVSCAVTVQAGDRVRELRSSWDRVGSALVVADTPAEAVRLAAAATGRVQLKVRPVGDAG
jgi:biotin carboxylase